MKRADLATLSDPAQFANFCNSSADKKIELAFDENTPLDTVRAILTGLPDDWRLCFYDRDYCSPSSPGSYVDVARRGDHFLFQRANHHWHGQWQKRTLAKMAELVYQCRTHQDPERSGQIVYVYVEKAGSLSDREIAAAKKSR